MAVEDIQSWKIGDVEVYSIVEIAHHSDPIAFLLEGGTPELMKQYDWLFPHYATPEGDMIISFQAFLVKTPEHTIMVDTCIGNEKRRRYGIHDQLQSSFIEDLASLGVTPDMVDIVLCTHLHFDHVGWNTRRVDGKWVPTFPNATYLFGREEWEELSKMPLDGGVDAEHIVDSIQPIFDADLAEFVESRHQVCAELFLEPTPGHTVGHVSVNIESKGDKGVITGDLMHHPIQFAEPEMLSNFCLDKPLAAKTRKDFIDRHEQRQSLIIGSHFPKPTAGRISKADRNWRFNAQTNDNS